MQDFIKFYWCTMVLYKYMDSLRNDIYDLFFNAHARNKIYWQFDHGIIYIPNEGRYVRICDSPVVFSGYSGFRHQYNLTPRYNWNVFESSVKHHNP
jgi:DNA modification methylase